MSLSALAAVSISFEPLSMVGDTKRQNRRLQ